MFQYTAASRSINKGKRQWPHEFPIRNESWDDPEDMWPEEVNEAMKAIVNYARDHVKDIPPLGKPFHVANHEEWIDHSETYLETGVASDGWEGYKEGMVGKTRRTAKKRGRTGARTRQTSKSRATRRGKKVSVSANMSQETPEEDDDVLGAIPEEETERPLRRSRRTATGEESEQKRPRYREYSSGEDEDEGEGSDKSDEEEDEDREMEEEDDEDREMEEEDDAGSEIEEDGDEDRDGDGSRIGDSNTDVSDDTSTD